MLVVSIAGGDGSPQWRQVREELSFFSPSKGKGVPASGGLPGPGQHPQVITWDLLSSSASIWT